MDRVRHSAMLSGLAFCALVTTTAVAQSVGPLRPQLSYVLLRFNAAEDGSASHGADSWQRADLLRAALQKTGAHEERPLIEGWITATTYGRLNWDREDYLVFAPKLNTPLAEVCHVIVTDVVRSFTQPQTFSIGGGGGDKWCSEPGRADEVPTPDQIRAKWPRGEVADIAQFRLPEGATVTARHIVGVRQYGWPLPPAKVANILTMGLLPTSLDGARRNDRQLDLARLADGRWAVTLKYSLNLSGCFLTNSRPSALPSEAWITPEVERWCTDHDAGYLASIPVDQRPRPIPTMGSVRKPMTGDW